jgi:hypothetical protein
LAPLPAQGTEVSLIGSGASGGTRLRGGWGPRGGVHRPGLPKSVQRRKNNARIKKMVAPKVGTDEQVHTLMLTSAPSRRSKC